MASTASPHAGQSQHRQTFATVHVFSSIVMPLVRNRNASLSRAVKWDADGIGQCVEEPEFNIFGGSLQNYVSRLINVDALYTPYKSLIYFTHHLICLGHSPGVHGSCNI